jgi:sigma-B regulation protein RsbU (phosphoserine phosphatase)
MKTFPPSVVGFFRRQQLYVFLAVVIGGIFWAIHQSINPWTVIVYSLCIGNLLSPAMQATYRLYFDRPFPYNWAIFLGLLAILVLPVYVISTVIVWWLAPPTPQSLSHLLFTGWNFPCLVTFIFGIVNHHYAETKHRLEKRNIELQRAIKANTAQLETQEQDLQRALEIQRALLPKNIPQVGGFEIAGAWQPARVVGGDYYDVLTLSGSRLGICIADVVGKGVSAALLMANLQAAVHAFAQDAPSPAWLCSRVNAVLCSNIAEGKFVTFFYGILDAATRQFEFCNAGHMPPLLINDSGSLRVLAAGGLVLGMFRDAEYANATFGLAPGDRLLLFTDGITEAFSPAGEEYGEERLAMAALEHRRLSAQELNQRLLAEVGDFCKGQFHDDATLVVIVANPRAGETLPS